MNKSSGKGVGENGGSAKGKDWDEPKAPVAYASDCRIGEQKRTVWSKEMRSQRKSVLPAPCNPVFYRCFTYGTILLDRVVR